MTYGEKWGPEPLWQVDGKDNPSNWELLVHLELWYFRQGKKGRMENPS